MTSFILPATFQAAEFLTTPRLMMNADDARWLVSTILTKTANRDTDLWGCVRLDSQILRRVMYKNTATEIVRALELGGAIETAAYYAGVKCKGYRLAGRYLGDRCLRLPIQDPRLLDRIERERQRLESEELQTRWKPIHHQLDAEQHGLMIDVEQADLIMSTLPEHTRLCQDVLVCNLRHRELPFSVSTTGRVFNSITGLKRELRHALRYGGACLGSVDIRCAQPGLLALALARFSPSNVLKQRARYKHWGSGASFLSLLPSCSPGSLLLPHDASLFGSLATNGGLYEKLVTLTGLDRETVKLSFLRDVLAKKGRYPSVVEQAVQDAFPTVLAFIRAVNRDDHGELIRHLQRMESWLVVECVAPRLLGRVPTITLHDAIYSTVPDLPVVETAFGEVFDEIGFRLSLKREGK